MSEEFFYHYTNTRNATPIILSGKILPNGDAVHGEGVYLTTFDPGLGRQTVVNNNWDGLATARRKNYKMNSYFEILMPSSKVRRAKEKRDIQVHTGELLLADYKWSLKNWQGELLATQHFMISSEGKAAEDHPESMGRYTLMRSMVTNGHHPVYKHDDEEGYIFMNADGLWGASDVAGFEECFLRQNSDFSPSPCKTIPWEFWDDNFNGWEGDVSLRVYPCF